MVQWILSNKSEECSVCKKYGKITFGGHDLTVFTVGIENRQYRERMEQLLKNDSRISRTEAFKQVVLGAIELDCP